MEAGQYCSFLFYGDGTVKSCGKVRVGRGGGVTRVPPWLWARLPNIEHTMVVHYSFLVHQGYNTHS